MEKLTPKAVIFDLGSTLIDYEKTPWDILAKECMANVAKVLRKQHNNIPEDEKFIDLFESVKSEYRKLAADKYIEWSIPQAVKSLLRKIDIEADEVMISKLFDAYYKPVEKNLEVYNDTFDTLSKVKEAGKTIGLVSNTIFPASAHIGELKRFDLTEFFDFKIFSSTFGVRKPHADIFLAAANRAGVAPSECVYIGDRYLEDVTGPESIGMPAILKKLEKREYPKDMPENIRTISTLSGILDYIDLGNDEVN
ncbi:MAG: HAD family hydrolase [Calditrichaeota bacterium]|nr:MAG: HAD family hydrolase [Calditrichota bacterium]